MILFYIRSIIYPILLIFIIKWLMYLYRARKIYKFSKDYIPDETRTPFIVCGYAFIIVETNDWYMKHRATEHAKLSWDEKAYIMSYLITTITNRSERGWAEPYDGIDTDAMVSWHRLKYVMRDFVQRNEGKLYLNTEMIPRYRGITRGNAKITSFDFIKLRCWTSNWQLLHCRFYS